MLRRTRLRLLPSEIMVIYSAIYLSVHIIPDQSDLGSDQIESLLPKRLTKEREHFSKLWISLVFL